MPRIDMVPHTHWDREWYLTFERFRERLVETLDLVLDCLRNDERWTHFHLDGQTAMVDDYLSMRPEREPELRSHVEAGRLSCGPWVTLVDEFLVSGESIIRNLAEGMARAAELGGAMQVAYVPDQFGHIGQLPQLLASQGLGRAFVWRGVPSQVNEAGFVWESPDGSSVDVRYPPFGYWQGQRMETDRDEFVNRLRLEIERGSSWLRDGEALLLMTGDDHERPNPRLPDLVEHARSKGLDVRLTSLADALEGWARPKPRVRGELRSAARANLLPNTYSVRPRQKIERAEAEAALERYAEPVAALVEGFDWPEHDLAEAWMQLHLNGAHDSVCGCSTDEVAAAVDARTAAARTVADQITAGALATLGESVEAKGWLHFNPSPFERDGIPALGWAVTDEGPAAPSPVPLRVQDDWVVLEIGGRTLRLTARDQGDDGDLYTFEPRGNPLPPQSVVASDEEVHCGFATCDLTLHAASGADGRWVRLSIEVDNRAPDHRLQLALEATPTETTQAGSPFEIVRRPLVGEGGPSEPGSAQWPARGFVVGGGVGWLAPGVFEYEVTSEGLAVTVMRCTGTISRSGGLAARREAAGPEVPTPEAQLIGYHRFELGVLASDDALAGLRAFEQFALPPATIRTSGGGILPARGSLVDLDAPALSTITRQDGRVLARVWNPTGRTVRARAGEKSVELGPYRIEAIEIPGR